jgi:DNA repair exonuclease SbcCD ATPase subunit
MSIDTSSWTYIILFAQVSINLVIFVLYLSSLRAKKSSDEEIKTLRDEIGHLNSRLSAKDLELSELLAQKSESEEDLKKAFQDKAALKQEYEKKSQDPIKLKELEIIREENQKLNARLSVKEQELAKALSQKAAAEEAFTKAREDRGVLKQEYEKELQGLVDRKEFERLQQENQKLNSEALAKEAELSKISAQKTALEEAVNKAVEGEVNLRREYESKIQGLVDRNEFGRLQQENQRLNTLVSAKEQELAKTMALKSAIEGAFREISSSRVVLGKEEEAKAKKLLKPEILERFKKEQERLNAQVLAKEQELAEVTAQNSAAQGELAKIKSDFLSEKQKLSKSTAQEREKIEAQLKLKEKDLAQALEQKDKLADELRKNKETMVERVELEALQEKVKQALQEQANLKEEYEKKLQGRVDRKEFERLREENQKLNAELVAKDEKISAVADGDTPTNPIGSDVAPEEKKGTAKKSAKADKDLRAAEAPSKAKAKERAESKETPETDKSAKSKGRGFAKAPGSEPTLGVGAELPQDLIPYVQEQEAKIGELLLSNGLIEESLWQKAISYQKQHKGSSLVQYLLAYGHLKEEQLAECLCDYFKIPYLPLSKYEIPEEVIKQIPQDILERYLVIPVFQSGNIINVVMGNPFDAKAIRAIEDTTGFKVRPFVGLFSEIIATLKVYVRFSKSEGSEKYPFLVETKSYTGLERRESVRIDAALDIEFLAEGGYKRSVTKNVSRDGFCFEAEISLPVGSIFPIMVYLPVHINPLPIKVITKVVKAIPLTGNKFELRLMTVKISKEDLNKIIEFASQNK